MKNTKLYKVLGCFGLALLLSLLFIKVDSQASVKRTTMLDVSSFKADQKPSPQGWSWDHTSKILTLDNVDFEVSSGYAIQLPREGCTIFVKGNNKIKADNIAISCVMGTEDTNRHIGTLMVRGSGTLDITAGLTAFQYEGEMYIGELDLNFTGGNMLNGISNLIICEANVTAKGTYADYDSEYPLIGTKDEDYKQASLMLSDCYIEKGGASIKKSEYCCYIGTADEKAANNIQIKQGNPPKAVAAIAAKTMKFSKNYSKLGISWNVPKYSDGKYEVWRSTKKGSGYKKIATVYRPYYQDKKLKFRKKYYYKIKAFTQGTAKASMSGYKAVTTGLANVDEFYYENMSGRVYLAWTKVYGAQGYVLYKATSRKGKYTAFKTITKGSTKKYNFKRPKNSKNYYKIRAYRKVGKKKYFSAYKAAVENDLFE